MALIELVVVTGPAAEVALEACVVLKERCGMPCR